MIRFHRAARRSLSVAVILGSAFLGIGLGVAIAQDRMPGQLDAGCASRCMAGGEDAAACEKRCWIPAIPSRVRPEEVTDAVCLRTCLERGLRYSDCKPRCKLPIAE